MWILLAPHLQLGLTLPCCQFFTKELIDIFSPLKLCCTFDLLSLLIFLKVTQSARFSPMCSVLYSSVTQAKRAKRRARRLNCGFAWTDIAYL